jgi:hypothetical protein
MPGWIVVGSAGSVPVSSKSAESESSQQIAGSELSGDWKGRMCCRYFVSQVDHASVSGDDGSDREWTIFIHRRPPKSFTSDGLPVSLAVSFNHSD